MHRLGLACVATVVCSSLLAAEPGLSDLSGFWVGILEPEDQQYRGPGPEFGDFRGLPFNEAGLARARSWNPDDDYLPENVSKPPSVPYIMRSTLPIQIIQEEDEITFRLELCEQVRTIHMDGRSHPSADAPRTYMGHSVGHWEGQTLVVDTTHFAEGYIRRNGAMHSNQGHLIERYTRDGDYLLLMIVLEDPAYFSESLTRVIAFRSRPDVTALRPFPC